MKIPENIHRVYFLGIGGIGMSALARYFRQQGVTVSGYDVDRAGMGKVLAEEGFMVHYTEAESIAGETPDLVVYTPAIPVTHRAMQHYRALGTPVMKRSEVLGWISRKYRCIAVAGTHGKTTTSAMITQALRHADVSVTAFLGGIVPDLDGNFISGTSEWLVVEADEYDRSFLTLSPEIAVVTAMDADHLDVYGDHAAMIEAYSGFMRNVRDNGMIVIHESAAVYLSDRLLQEWKDRGIEMMTYGVQKGDYRLTEVRRTEHGVRFGLARQEDSEIAMELRMPGVHNALNAVAAIAVCDRMKVRRQPAINGLAAFTGIRRRFEVVYSDRDMVMIDDYAHHPKELLAAISAARLQYPERRITGVFQPHLYTRTRDFFQEFAEALDTLDVCVLVELYPARELPLEGVTSKLILDAMTIEHTYLTTKKDLAQLLASLRPEVLLLLGAGDLDRMIPQLIETLTS